MAANPAPYAPNTPMPATSPRKSWLGRNWKWLLLTLVAGFFVFVGGIFALAVMAIRGSDVARESVARAQSNPAFVQKLGGSVTEGWFVRGSISTAGDGSGVADLAVPVSGRSGSALIYVKAAKTAGQWVYSQMVAAIGGDGGQIDLLQPPAATPASTANASASAPSPAPANPEPSQPPQVAGDAAATMSSTAPAQDTNVVGVIAQITECARENGVLSIRLLLRNTTSQGKHVDLLRNRNYDDYYLSAAGTKYRILKDTDGTYLTPGASMFGGLGIDLDPGGQYNWWARFPAPPASVKAVSLYTPIAPPFDEIPVTDK